MDIKEPFSDAKKGSVSKVAGSRVGLVFQNQKMTCSRLSSPALMIQRCHRIGFLSLKLSAFDVTQWPWEWAIRCKNEQKPSVTAGLRRSSVSFWTSNTAGWQRHKSKLAALFLHLNIIISGAEADQREEKKLIILIFPFLMSSSVQSL